MIGFQQFVILFFENSSSDASAWGHVVPQTPNVLSFYEALFANKWHVPSNIGIPSDVSLVGVIIVTIDFELWLVPPSIYLF